MNRRSAFTLVELLVVIGIIALLIAILMPALNRARQAAIQTACLSNIRQTGMSLLMYVQDNNNYLPRGYYAPPDTAYEGQTYFTWAYVLKVNGYFEAPYKMGECPAMPFVHAEESVNRTYEVFGFHADYSGKLITKLRTPVDRVLLADTVRKELNRASCQFYNNGIISVEPSAVHLRHRGRSTAFFADGHAEAADEYRLRQDDIVAWYTEEGVYRQY